MTSPLESGVRQELEPKANCTWRPLYWEPVSGTGERLMVGVVYGFAGEFRATRTIRDDALEGLFGKASAGLRRLIDHALAAYQAAARAGSSLDPTDVSIAGLHAGPLRNTEAASSAELLQTACLLYSSLGNLDKLDAAEESDAPQQDEVNRRFGSEVRIEVARRRPELMAGFGRGGALVPGGQLVKFGYFSPRTVVHFTVLNPVKQSTSVRDARARIFELSRAREIAGIERAALIAAVPRDDDATLGARQRESLKANRAEIEAEADAMRLRWFAVNTAAEGAGRLIDLAS